MTRNILQTSAETLRRAILRSAYGDAYLETLDTLRNFLQSFPSGQRRWLCCDALLFMPGHYWLKELEIGRARALISDGIERLTGAPPSMPALRQLASDGDGTPLSIWMAHLTLASEWEIHFFLMEISRRLLVWERRTNSSARRPPAAALESLGSGQPADDLLRTWPVLPAHLREAIWTLVNAARPQAADGTLEQEEQ